jgi:hypothetical protein
MRKIGKFLNTTNGEIRINPKSEFTKPSDYETRLGYLQSNDIDRPAGKSRFPDHSYYGITTSQFDLSSTFSPQEKELVYALQNHPRLALQLSKHLDEAKKAVALAESSRIARWERAQIRQSQKRPSEAGIHRSKYRTFHRR